MGLGDVLLPVVLVLVPLAVLFIDAFYLGSHIVVAVVALVFLGMGLISAAVAAEAGG